LHEVSVQVPVEQLAAPFAFEQVTPQPPQFALVVSSVSQPLAWLLSQLPKPTLHEPTWQVLFEHAAVALGTLHAWPQVPQFAAELVVLVSQPSSPLLLQSAKPVLQVTV